MATGSTVASFIPEVWSARFLKHLDDRLVWGMVTNRNYEGDITSAGDTVKIPVSSTSISVRDYTINTDIGSAEQAAGTTLDLLVDKQKYFHFYVDDLDKAQSRPDVMDDAMGRAGFEMANQMDSDIMTAINTTYNASRRVAALTEETTADGFGAAFLKAVAKAKRILDALNTYDEQKWMIIHPDTMEALNVYFITNNPAGVFLPATAEETLRNGFAGRLLGFNLYETNKVPDGIAQSADATRRLWCGPGMEPVTLAAQILETEAYRPERRFGDAVKGLNVYGVKVVRPELLHTIEHKHAE